MAKKTIAIRDAVDRAALIDELGRRHGELSKAEREHEKRIADLKDLVRGWADADGLGAGQSRLYLGTRYAVQVGARKNRRRIVSLLHLFAIWGRDKFLSLCSVSLGDADENLTPAQRAECIAEDQAVGERDVKPTELAAGAISKAA